MWHRKPLIIPNRLSNIYRRKKIYLARYEILTVMMQPFYSKESDTSKESRLFDAATVILTRDKDGAPFELFLMQRHQKQSFMGSAFVFPGGRLDEADCDSSLAAYGQGLSAEEAKLKLNEPGLSKEKTFGLFFAAVRETFEEAGVLLAAHTSGGKIDFSEHEINSRYNAYRSKLHNQEISLKELAQKEDIRYSLDLLEPYAHWITPENEFKRFNTRFLLARMPRNQAPIHDSVEMTESLWITPADALKQQEAGKILLMPPTLKTMEELSEFSTTGQLLTAAASRKIQPILPQAFSTPDGFGVRLPHDPEYSISGSKQPPRPDEPSRIVMKDGRWKTVMAESD